MISRVTLVITCLLLLQTYIPIKLTRARTLEANVQIFKKLTDNEKASYSSHTMEEKTTMGTIGESLSSDISLQGLDNTIKSEVQMKHDGLAVPKNSRQRRAVKIKIAIKKAVMAALLALHMVSKSFRIAAGFLFLG